MALRKPAALAAALLAVAALPALLAAPTLVGDVNPPPGPVTGTMKPLSQVEPRTPVESLPGNASVMHLISQPGSYYLTGNLSAPGGAVSGIEIATPGVTLDLGGFALTGNGSTGAGVIVTGFQRTNIVIRNGTVSGWSQGVNAVNTVNSQVAGICADGNAPSTGISLGANGIVRECTARNSGAVGIAAGNGSLVVECTATGNQNAGIYLSGVGAQAVRCTAYGNQAPGFLVQAGQCAVIECTASNNADEGILAASGSMILRNQCNANGTVGTFAGIHVTGTDNRIEGNSVIGNDVGLDVDVAGNFIVQNSASGNTTNYLLTGTQTVGPIITSTGTITSTNPWANFEF